MKRLIATLALGFAVVAVPVWAADAPAKSTAVVGKKSMAPDGRFHQLHTKKLALDCGTCHKDANPDVLFLRNTEAPPPGLQAQVDRNGCISCHKAPMKPTWYGAAR